MKLLILVFTILAAASASYHTIHRKYHGPEHHPIIRKGVPVEPTAVQEARSAHLKTLHEAKYNKENQNWNHENYVSEHRSIIRKGVPVEPVAVQYARKAHLKAVEEAKQITTNTYNNGYEHSNAPYGYKIKHTQHEPSHEGQYVHHEYDYEGQYNHQEHDYEHNYEQERNPVVNDYYQHNHEISVYHQQVPMLGNDGTPLDTVEVAAAKAKHFVAVNEALARNSHGNSHHYRHRRSAAGYKVSTKNDKHGYSIHQEHAPVYGHQENRDVYAHDYGYKKQGDDNCEYQQRELDEDDDYEHQHYVDYDNQKHDYEDHYEPENNPVVNDHHQLNHEISVDHHQVPTLGNDGTPLDTDEVTAAKAKHFAAVNEALARNAHGNSHHYRHRRSIAGYKVSTKNDKHGYSIHQEHAPVYGHQENRDVYAHDYGYKKQGDDNCEYQQRELDEDDDYEHQHYVDYDNQEHDYEDHYEQENNPVVNDHHQLNHEISVDHHQVPTLGHDGTPLDTDEVTAAKAKHFAAVNEALGRNGHGNSHHYRHRRSIAGYKVSTKNDKHGYSIHQEHAPVYGYQANRGVYARGYGYKKQDNNDDDHENNDDELEQNVDYDNQDESDEDFKHNKYEQHHVDYESNAYTNQLHDILEGSRNNGVFKLGHNKVEIIGDKHGLSKVIIGGYEQGQNEEAFSVNDFEGDEQANADKYGHQYQLFNGQSHQNNGDKLVGMIYAETTKNVYESPASDTIYHQHVAGLDSDGRPLDTLEVQLAKAQHFLDYHQAANQGNQNLGQPVAPIDTPEVQIARALHLSHVNKVNAKHY